MSRQNKLRAKRKHTSSGNKGPKGESGYPHQQAAPLWVRNGTRIPKAVRERIAKQKEEREAAEREARKAAREAAHAD